MQVRVLSHWDFAQSGTTIVYLIDDCGRVGMWMLPADKIDNVTRIPSLSDESLPLEIAIEHGQPRWSVDPLVHVHVRGSSMPASFSQGRTLRNGPSTSAMKFQTQDVERDGHVTSLVTKLASESGIRCTHRLSFDDSAGVARVGTTCFNRSAEPVTLELLTSFSLGGITPFTTDYASGRLKVHRVRSSWASEGRLDSQAAEAMQLEPSFSRYGASCERFGQVGTMPTRGFFPFAALEDTTAGVTWGAQLAWAGSWQIELYRKDDTLSLSGGLADYEFGHWAKTLTPGESFTTPAAILATVQGGLDELCDRLTAAQHRAADSHPAVDHDLPIVFNEWCTTWGKPTHDKVVAQAEQLRDTAVKYLVIDAGWYGGADGTAGHGVWTPKPANFPDGLKATADAVRAAGLIPGLWFEFENCAKNTPAFGRTSWHLKRDGHPITVCDRRFWDLNNPEVVDYLAERVIGLLGSCGFGYLKVDYNETIGIGCDGRESLGEGLRRQVEASQRFFQRIRDELPDLVIESCASGGHRLEPSMLALSAMSSFSDAHESRDIPIIAANLHRVMLPRQSQIWAVLRKTDDEQRLAYSLAATFLGRMCISGDITDLSESQWDVYRYAESLYRQAAPVIKHGVSRKFGGEQLSYRSPVGWQAVVRTRDDRQQALVVVHTFADSPGSFEVSLPSGRWTVSGTFAANSANLSLRDDRLRCTLGDWAGAVILLEQAR